MPYNNADFAVVLPNNQLPLGQVMQNAIGLEEKKQARQDSLDEKRYESEQRNELARQNKMQSNALHNLGTINKYVAEYKPIEASVDELVSTNIKGYKDFLMQNIGKDPIELDRLMSERTPAIANAYKKMQSDLPLMKQQEADFLKQMPNADPIAVREVIRNQFKQRYTSVDKNGNEILKEPIEDGYDYTKIFQDPEKLSWVVGNNQQPLKDFFDKVKYEAVSGNEYSNNKGQVIGKKWSGYKTPYSGALGVDEKGFPKIDVAYEEIPMKNGTLQIAGETLRNDMKANPAVERTFDIAWLNKKKEKGLTNIDAATDEKMKEAYRLEYARQHIKHNVNTSEIEKTPVIKVSVGGKDDKNYTQNFVSRFVDATKNGTSEDMVNIARELFTGNGSATFENMKVDKDNKGISIYYRDREFGVPSDEVKVLKLNPNDPNFPYELAGAYQRLTGSDTKLEKAIFSGKGAGIDKTQTTPKKPATATVVKKLQGALD